MSHSDYFKKFKTTVISDETWKSGRSNNSSEIVHMSINITGSRLVNSRSDKSIRVWKCALDKIYDPTIIEHPHSKVVECVSWHPKHEFTFATVGGDNLVKIWKVTGSTSTCERTISVDNAKHLYLLRYSNDGERLAIVDRELGLLIYSTKNYTLVEGGDTIQPKANINVFQWFNRGHEFFVIGLNNGTLEIYNGDFKLNHCLKGHRSSITSIAIDPRGKYIAAGSNEGVVSFWNTDNLLVNAVLTSVDEAISSVETSKDGQFISIGYDRNENVKIFEVNSLQEVIQIENSIAGKMQLSQLIWFPNKTAYVYVSDAGKTMTFGRKS